MAPQEQWEVAALAELPEYLGVYLEDVTAVVEMVMESLVLLQEAEGRVQSASFGAKVAHSHLTQEMCDDLCSR